MQTGGPPSHETYCDGASAHVPADVLEPLSVASIDGDIGVEVEAFQATGAGPVLTIDAPFDSKPINHRTLVA